MKWADDLTKLLQAAAGAVVTMWGLFNSVLSEWVPPTAAMGEPAITGLASLVSLGILLALVLVMRRRLNLGQRRQIAAVAGAAAVAGLAVAFVYHGDLMAHVFVWPPQDKVQSGEDAPKRYIRGEFNDMGIRVTKDTDLSSAIEEAGGLATAQSHQTLWSEASRQQVERRLVWLYVAMSSLLSGAVFGLALAVLFSPQTGASAKAPPQL